VNTNGDLIGINSAISSNTGYYEGYGFAVPSNLAKKVVEDIKKFGLVQRGFLGIVPLDLSNENQVQYYNQQEKTNIKANSGIYIISVSDNGGAEDAGLRKGDIIKKIDSDAIDSYSDLSAAIGSKRPGDKVSVTYLRNGKETTSNVILKDQKGGTSFRSKEDLSVTEKIGGEFENLNENFKIRYGINSGVLAKNITEGGELAKVGVYDNCIIVEINNKPVNSQKDVEKLLDGYKGNVQIKYMDDYGRLYNGGFKMP
jgi:S1-C subfamily serine protease